MLHGLKFASKEVGVLVDYISGNPDIADVLLTGGDPLTMKTKVLESKRKGLNDRLMYF
jgi:L-lysine 2,3-aminomutase